LLVWLDAAPGEWSVRPARVPKSCNGVGVRWRSDIFPVEPMYRFRSFLIPLTAALALAAPGWAHGMPAADVTGVAETGAVVRPALGRLHVTDPVPSLFAGAEAAGSVLGAAAAPAGTLTELATTGAQGRYAAPGRQESSYPQRVARRGSQLPEEAAALPESPPSGWAVLLCGLAVVVFVARRKLSLR
jgi:hypothetical protein